MNYIIFYSDHSFHVICYPAQPRYTMKMRTTFMSCYKRGA